MSSGKLFFSSSIRSRTRSAVAMALASGSCEDGEAGVGLAVELAGGVQVAGAELDVADVLDADLAAVGVGAEDDVLELLGLGQPAEGGDR